MSGRSRPFRLRRRIAGLLTATFLLGAVSPLVAEAEGPTPAAGPITKRCTVNANGPFASSDTTLAASLNNFWSIYCTSTSDLEINNIRRGHNSAWLEWDALKFAWTAKDGYRSEDMAAIRNWKVNGFNGATGDQPGGYVWSWTSSERWPDAEGRGHNGVGSFHFEQQARFIDAVAEYYRWTGDDEFLHAMMPMVESVMDYMLTEMNGIDGTLTVPGDLNNGVSGDTDRRSSTYLDQIQSGHLDAWVNVGFYTSLLSMATLQEASGDIRQSEVYEELARKAKKRFDQTFWSDGANRYIGWVDAEGIEHDSGYVHINIEALTRGLGDQEKANAIFDWLGRRAQPLEFGPHQGSEDVYAYVVSPRTTTQSVPDEDWDGWSDPGSGRKPYGDIVQDGGTLMWMNYYDVMARLRYQGADAAVEKLRAMLDRIEADDYCLTFNPDLGRFYNSFGESLVQVGSNLPFPESGIAMRSVLDGMIGANPTQDGLTVQPNLPSDLMSLTAKEINYRGRDLAVQISRGDTVINVAPSDRQFPFQEEGTPTQQFTSNGEFNSAGIFLKALNDTSRTAATVELQKKVGPHSQTVGTRRITKLDTRGQWVDVSVAPQAPGEYRLTGSDIVNQMSWSQAEGSTSSDLKLSHRVLNKNLKPVLASTTRTFTADKSFSRVELAVRGDTTTTIRIQRRDGSSWSLAAEIPARPSSGRLVIDVNDLPAGHYRLSTNRGVSIRKVTLAAQQYTASAADRSVTVAAGESETLVGQ